MYGCESWTLKKAEHWRIDVFELRCWRRLLRVPWTATRSNQSILKEISPEYSLEGLMLKVKLLATRCEELTHWKRPRCWERLKAGGEGDDRGWVGWMASLTRWTWVWASSGVWWWTGKPGMLKSMGSQRIGHDRVTELNWTEIAPSKATSQLILSPKYVSVSETGSTWLRLLMRGSYLFLWDSTDVPLAPARYPPLRRSSNTSY